MQWRLPAITVHSCRTLSGAAGPGITFRCGRLVGPSVYSHVTLGAARPHKFDPHPAGRLDPGRVQPSWCQPGGGRRAPAGARPRKRGPILAARAYREPCQASEASGGAGWTTLAGRPSCAHSPHPPAALPLGFPMASARQFTDLPRSILRRPKWTTESRRTRMITREGDGLGRRCETAERAGSIDPRGDPSVGRSVRLTVDRIRPVRRTRFTGEIRRFGTTCQAAGKRPAPPNAGQNPAKSTPASTHARAINP